ncbi:MAG TPA: AmmeMemoRadiSam system protein B [Candidatus Krumholzibacteria bacterium]
MKTGSAIREPAVAGWFYPRDTRELASMVDTFIGGDAATRASSTTRMLLAPHAGYPYSGAIAGRGFARVRAGGTPSRAFIIGPSHVEAFDYTSVFAGSAYRTPLGALAVDRDAALALAQGAGTIRLSGAGHDLPSHGRGEHGIEVELPFLQRCFGDVTIVPVVMGRPSWDACEELGRAIAAQADWSRDIVIASSDLSHFYDDATARALDGVFCDTLATLDARALHERLARRECEACGAGPVVAGLIATEALRDRACELVSTGNSGDVSDDRSSVVGYASAVVTGSAA